MPFSGVNPLAFCAFFFNRSHKVLVHVLCNLDASILPGNIILQGFEATQLNTQASMLKNELPKFQGTNQSSRCAGGGATSSGSTIAAGGEATSSSSTIAAGGEATSSSSTIAA